MSDKLSIMANVENNSWREKYLGLHYYQGKSGHTFRTTTMFNLELIKRAYEILS